MSGPNMMTVADDKCPDCLGLWVISRMVFKPKKDIKDYNCRCVHLVSVEELMEQDARMRMAKKRDVIYIRLTPELKKRLIKAGEKFSLEYPGLLNTPSAIAKMLILRGLRDFEEEKK